MLRQWTLPILAVTTLVAWAIPQERVQKHEADFDTLHRTTADEFHSGHYGRSLAAARKMTALIQGHRHDAVLACMPAAPDGYSVVPERRQRLDPALATATAAFGHVIQRRYRASDGRGELQVTVTADSPLIQMFQTWVTNPSLLGTDGELIRYEAHHAVLRKDGPAHSLQIPIGDALLEARVRGRDGDFLLKLLDQKAVTTLDRAIRS